MPGTGRSGAACDGARRVNRLLCAGVLAVFASGVWPPALHAGRGVEKGHGHACGNFTGARGGIILLAQVPGVQESKPYYTSPPSPAVQESKPYYTQPRPSRAKAAPNKRTRPSHSSHPRQHLYTAQKKPPMGQSHWLNTQSGVRHNRRCKWFEKTLRGRYCSPTEGRPCRKCGG